MARSAHSPLNKASSKVFGLRRTQSSLHLCCLGVGRLITSLAEHPRVAVPAGARGATWDAQQLAEHPHAATHKVAVLIKTHEVMVQLTKKRGNRCGGVCMSWLTYNPPFARCPEAPKMETGSGSCTRCGHATLRTTRTSSRRNSTTTTTSFNRNLGVIAKRHQPRLFLPDAGPPLPAPPPPSTCASCERGGWPASAGAGRGGAGAAAAGKEAVAQRRGGGHTTRRLLRQHRGGWCTDRTSSGSGATKGGAEAAAAAARAAPPTPGVCDASPQAESGAGRTGAVTGCRPTRSGGGGGGVEGRRRALATWTIRLQRKRWRRLPWRQLRLRKRRRRRLRLRKRRRKQCRRSLERWRRSQPTCRKCSPPSPLLLLLSSSSSSSSSPSPRMCPSRWSASV